MAQKAPRGKEYSPAYEDIDYYIRTEPITIKAATTDTPYPILRAIGSSETIDLEGDRMLRSALQDMTTLPGSQEHGRPMFFNHSYLMPEDIVARLLANPDYQMRVADVTTKGIKAGTEYAVIQLMARIMDNNPRAIQMMGYAERGTDIGVSVGLQVTDYEIRYDKKSGAPEGIDVVHNVPLEFSTVGIPCHQSCWVTDAVDGIARRKSKAFRGIALDDDHEIAYRVKNWGDFDGIDELLLKRMNDALLPHDLCIARIAPLV